MNKTFWCTSNVNVTIVSLKKVKEVFFLKVAVNPSYEERKEGYESQFLDFLVFNRTKEKLQQKGIDLSKTGQLIKICSFRPEVEKKYFGEKIYTTGKVYLTLVDCELIAKAKTKKTEFSDDGILPF